MQRQRLLFFLGFLFLASSVARPAAASDIQLQIVYNVLAGQEKPRIVIIANKSVKNASLTLRRNDGRAVSANSGFIKRGRRHTINLPNDIGSWRFSGALAVVYRDGAAGDVPLEFDVLVAEDLKLDVPKDRLDIDNGRVDVQLDRDADYCEYVVYLDSPDPPIQGRSDFHGAPAGTWLTVEWAPRSSQDVVLRIDLTCSDIHGFSRGWTGSPWWLELPHEDVNFTTGKWDVLPAEAPKLDHALGELQTAIRRYSQVVEIKLFISGHTDTVGDAESNLVLSRKRAHSIASYFRRKGIRVPIYYVGFGEDDLAVSTADETPEPLNRRARYVISNQPPAGGGWKAL